MKKQYYKNLWFVLPIIGIKRFDLWGVGEYQYTLCFAWLNRGIDIRLFKKKY